MSQESYRRTFQLGSTLRQVELLKVSFPILILLVTVLSITEWQSPIARANTCSQSICYVQAGYVAHTNTYQYVESTFTLPQSGDIVLPSGTTSSKFSIGVVLGGDSQFSSQNWAAAGIDIQVTNGQIASQTSFWSVTDGATTDGRGIGPGHGYFPTNVKNVKLGDTISASVELSNSVITFSMKDQTNPDNNTNQDLFSLPIEDSSKLPNGKTGGCILFFSHSNQNSNFAYPGKVVFSSCQVGANSASKQPIDNTSFPYTAQALPQPASLSSPDSNNGGFTVSLPQPASLSSPHSDSGGFTARVNAQAAGGTVSVWLTTADLTTHLAQQADLTFASGSGTDPTTITVDDSKAYQSMDGFGASFTNSSALLVSKLDTSQRNTLMTNLFDANRGIGLNFLRLPMGASDLTPPDVGEYSYDDVPQGQTDDRLDKFSIAHDQTLIPELQQALSINGTIKIMGTPWSAPAWMKSTDNLEGGTLNSSAYAAYANYFVKFIQAYKDKGIPIYAVTPQNEPLYTTTGYPNMSFPADQETNFIKNNLEPAFASNGINTKILGYDHNWDHQEYPKTILQDQTANGYTAGTAWHCYGGSVDAQTQVHDAYPNKDTYETECSGGQWENNALAGTMSLLIGAVRNWSRSVLRWAIALDANGQPVLPGTCKGCRGVVTIDQNSGNVTYNADYYGLGHASKFVVPGAKHIDSSAGSNGISDVAFQNPDGTDVLVVYNSSSSSQTFDVQWSGQSFSYPLPAGAAATFKWSGNH